MTIALTGEIWIGDFDDAFGRFRALVEALTAEIAPGTPIHWVIAALEYGSAIATVRGSSPQEFVPKIEEVVVAFERVGHALETNAEVPFSPRVVQPARLLRDSVTGRVQSIRLETPDVESVIVAEAIAKIVPLYKSIPPAPGAVEGRIQTVSNRGSLRFTLYDLVDDRAISCYVREGEQEQLRDLWGRLVIVEGRIKRDPVSGKPATVRDVTRITQRAEVERDTFRQARGAVPWKPGDPLPEAVIREMRDA